MTVRQAMRREDEHRVCRAWRSACAMFYRVILSIVKQLVRAKFRDPERGRWEVGGFFLPPRKWGKCLDAARRRDEGGGSITHCSDSVPLGLHLVVMRSENLTFARKNRRSMNEAEVRIWGELRRLQIGYRFRRQHPIGPYLVDFACIALRLVIELDGSQHHGSPVDLERDRYLELHGWTVLRFWSWEALSDTEMVINTILGVIGELEKAAR
jgi:very-short-patch-repair endonuclease